jgi:hypothetical protein
MTQGFSERPFVAGTVVGLRSFRLSMNCGCPECMTRSPGLLAATQGYRWCPGENVAACTPGVGVESPLPDHRPGTQECTCGFYAYFGRRNDYVGQCEITGIIEGYGLVTIGHLGFRAEKARIVALVAPFPFEPLREYGVPIYPHVLLALAEYPTTKPQDVGINPADYRPAENGIIWYGGTAFTPRYGKNSFTAAARQTASFTKLKQALTEDPLERKKANAQAAAEQRRKAGLRNSGGFDRRGRRR